MLAWSIERVVVTLGPRQRATLVALCALAPALGCNHDANDDCEGGARRIVDVARRFEQNGIVQSICQGDFGPAIERIARSLGDTIDRACLVN